MEKEKIQFVKDNYYKMRNTELASVLKVHPVTIFNIVNQLGLKKKGKGFINPIDVNIFNTPDGHYWIGYLMADGNINVTKTGKYVSLFSMDKEVIDKFSKFLGKYFNVYQRPSKLYEVKIGSTELANFLSSFGIIPNKSLIAQFEIPLNRDLLRGYFDGDGHIRKDRFEAKITSGSLDILWQIKEFLNFGTVTARKGETNACDIHFYNKSNIEQLYAAMYYDNCVCLTRKKQRFDSLLGNK